MGIRGLFFQTSLLYGVASTRPRESYYERGGGSAKKGADRCVRLPNTLVLSLYLSENDAKLYEKASFICNKARSNNRFCFQQRFGVEFREINGPEYTPTSYRRMTHNGYFEPL